LDRPADDSTRELQARDIELSAQSKNAEDVVVPVLKEELEIHKELRKTGTVRIVKTVHELEEAINESLASETVDVQRVPVDQIVGTLPQIRTEGDVTIVPVVKEEIVVTKQLRIVEELRITKRRSVSEYKENVKVRAEEVTVERIHSEDVNAES
jgi:stress response protein YsnF